MTNTQNTGVVDLKLVGPRTYTSPTLFSRAIKRGEVVKNIPIDRANVLLDLHSGEGDDKRYFFETASVARGVNKRAGGNNKRSTIEFDDTGADGADAQTQGADAGDTGATGEGTNAGAGTGGEDTGEAKDTAVVETPPKATGRRANRNKET